MLRWTHLTHIKDLSLNLCVTHNGTSFLEIYQDLRALAPHSSGWIFKVRHQRNSNLIPGIHTFLLVLQRTWFLPNAYKSVPKPPYPRTFDTGRFWQAYGHLFDTIAHKRLDARVIILSSALPSILTADCRISSVTCTILSGTQCHDNKLFLWNTRQWCVE
jgi:hypothetical protein